MTRRRPSIEKRDKAADVKPFAVPCQTRIERPFNNVAHCDRPRGHKGPCW